MAFLNRDRTEHTHVAANAGEGKELPNPVWFKPIMFGFMLLGLLWIITYYVSAGLFPLGNLGAGNIMIGFGMMFVGFIMTTRWR